MVWAAEHVLDLDEAKRKRTILRMDGHGGSRDDVNWALARGYHIHTKEYSGDRARKLAETVVTWYGDPKVAGRQVGWVTVQPTEYIRPVKHIAVRTRKKNGQWGIGVLISTLPLKAILTVLQERQVPVTISNHAGAYVCNHVYYMVLHTLQQMQSDALCGFIHVPLPTDAEETDGASTKLQTLGLVKAIEYTLDLLKDHVAKGSAG